MRRVDRLPPALLMLAAVVVALAVRRLLRAPKCCWLRRFARSANTSALQPVGGPDRGPALDLAWRPSGDAGLVRRNTGRGGVPACHGASLMSSGGDSRVGWRAHTDMWRPRPPIAAHVPSRGRAWLRKRCSCEI